MTEGTDGSSETRMKTKQEIFDQVVRHLRKQNAKAENEDGTCLYRTPDGKKCAAGCLIADEHYHPRCEGATVQAVPDSEAQHAVHEALIASCVPLEAFGLVSELQCAHDDCEVGLWPDEFASIADRHGLKMPEVQP